MGQRIESQTGESTEWLRRFWEPHLRDQADFNRPMDYLHWNPLKHGPVAQVADWPYSTFHRYVRAGVYPRNGGAGEAPPSIPKILANHRFRRVASPTINSRIESQENGGHRGFPFYEMPPVFIVWFGIRYWWAMPTTTQLDEGLELGKGPSAHSGPLRLAKPCPGANAAQVIGGRCPPYPAGPRQFEHAYPRFFLPCVSPQEAFELAQRFELHYTPKKRELAEYGGDRARCSGQATPSARQRR
jgi:Transposase and inactivated derivatives